MFKQKLNRKLKQYIDDFIHLIYPNLCIICENELSKYEKQICSFCFEDLSFSGFENIKGESKLDKLFWGRVKVEHTFSLLYFEKKGSTQKIVHPIKYKNRMDIAFYMGTLIGEKIKKSQISFNEIEFLVPVPLHINKRFTRGYNQSEILAKGIEKELNIKTNNNFLFRLKGSESQTKKNKFARWDNVQDTFSVKKTSYAPKHIAIIDDVVTTGSTIETCIKVILDKFPSTKISVFSLAFVN